MPSILKISDGTTTVDFVSSTSGYAVSRWNPVVARRRDNLLGGRGPYQDVDEEMEITIYGTDALSKLSTLQSLMEQATRWERGEDVDAVLLHYQPESTSTELKSTIIGAADVSMIELPGNFPDAPVYDYIDPVLLRFRRMGLWLGASVTATSSNVAHPEVATINLTTSVDVASPVVLKANGTVRSETGMISSYILMQSGATTTEAGSKIVVVNAEGMISGAGAGYSTAADSTNKALGNTVLKYTPGSTNQVTAGPLNIGSTASADARKWGVFVNYRSNSTNSGFKVGMLVNGTETVDYPIPVGTSNPAWAYLGAVSLSIPAYWLQLQVEATAATGSIDFDAIALLALDDTAHIVTPMPANHLGAATASFYPQVALSIDHQLLSQPTAAVWSSSTLRIEQGWRGDATLLMRGAAVSAAWLATGATTSTYWRVTDTAGSVITTGFTATRLEGLLTPE